MSLENYQTKEQLTQSAKHAFKDIKEGSYKILFNKVGICHLYKDLEYNVPEYILNVYDKGTLRSTMSKNNISEFKQITVFEILFDDYDINLVCVPHEDGNEIFIEKADKTRILVKKLIKTLNLEENNEYIIGKLVSHPNKDITYGEYSYYIKTIDKKQFWLGEKMAKRLQKHIKFTDDGTFITSDNKDEKIKLTLKTEGKETIKINGEDKTMIVQKIFIEFGDVKLAILGNKSYNLDFRKPVKYNILFVYINGKNVYLYDNLDYKYYLLNQDDAEMILNNIDTKIKDDYYKGVNQNLYTYILGNDGKRRGMIIKGDSEKNRTNTKCALNNYFKKKGSYDISKLQLQQTEEELKESMKAKTQITEEDDNVELE